MATTETQSKSGKGFAYSQNGNVVNVNWPAAQRLHEKKRAFIHKPASLKYLKQPRDDDFGPEAA